MTSIIALGAVTVGINLNSSRAELLELGLTPGGFTTPSVDEIERIRLALQAKRGSLPDPRSGGSVGNTAALIARAGISCGFMGVGGNDPFGRAFVSGCEEASLEFLSELQPGEVTGYDFYLYDETGERTIVLTTGANALLSPGHIKLKAVQEAERLLLDGFALSFGPESEAAVVTCIDAAGEAEIPFVLTLASTGIIHSYRHFYKRYAPRAEMVAGNLEQAATLVGLEPTAPLEMVRAELRKTSMNAIITMDAAGVFARFGDEEILVPAQAVDVLDSTGAGDNFLGAFLVARQKGLSIRKALMVGNHIAAEVIQYDSARLPLSVTVPELVEQAIRAADS